MNPVEEETEEGEERANAEPVAEDYGDDWGGAQFQIQHQLPQRTPGPIATRTGDRQKGRLAKPTLGMWIARPTVKTKNRFTELTRVDEEEGADAPSLCDSDCPTEAGGCECCNPSKDDEEDEVWTMPSVRKIQTPSPTGACSSKK